MKIIDATMKSATSCYSYCRKYKKKIPVTRAPRHIVQIRMSKCNRGKAAAYWKSKPETAQVYLRNKYKEYVSYFTFFGITLVDIWCLL